jgi:hypothetical protein
MKLASDVTTAGNYAACSLYVIKHNMAADSQHFTENKTGNGTTTPFVLANNVYFWCADFACAGLGGPDALTVAGVSKTASVQVSCASF